MNGSMLGHGRGGRDWSKAVNQRGYVASEMDFNVGVI